MKGFNWSLHLNSLIVVNIYPGWVFGVFGGYEKKEHYYMRVNRHSRKKGDSVINYHPGGNVTEITRYAYRNYAWPHVYPIGSSGIVGESIQLNGNLNFQGVVVLIVEKPAFKAIKLN